MKAIILAAGIGSRLGRPVPKPLTMLDNGETIIGRQIAILKKFMSVHDIIIVTGFKKELIMEEHPELLFAYNNEYDTTNTSKSLLRGLAKADKNADCIWLNGDVVFQEEVVEQVLNFKKSCMAVHNRSTGDEEVKYRLSPNGSICEISKQVVNGLGEAVGINKICPEQIELLSNYLAMCKPDDYFEKGIEMAINEGLEIYPVDITSYVCEEIDFIDDLNSINKKIKDNNAL